MNRTKQNFRTQTPTWLRVLCLTLLASWMGFQSFATTCATAVTIPGSPTMPYTAACVCAGTNDITTANATACGSGSYYGGQEALFKWVPTTTYSGVTIAYSGQTWTGITLFNGCPTSGGTCLGSITGSGSSKTLNVTGSITVGNTYYIMVDTWPTPNSPCPGNITINGNAVVPCSTPNPGNTLQTGVGFCTGVPITLSLQTATPGTGVTYQWQSAADTDPGFTSPTNLGTASTQVISTQTANTYYRCNVTCSTGPSTVASNPLLVNMNAATACYCIPTLQTTTYGCTDGDVIAQVAIKQGTTSLYTNFSGTGCPGGTSGYSDYTGLGSVVTLQAGNTYACEVFAGQYPEHYTAWMDYNDDGVFDATERLGYTTVQPAGSFAVGVLGGSTSFPITLACNPPIGTHRMRVRCAYNMANGLAITPCALTTSNYGETEDYLVTLNAAVSCPAPSSFTATATAGGADFDWVMGCAETDWEIHVTTVGGGAPTGTASNTGITAHPYSVTGLDPNTQYEAWLRADCDPSSGGGQSTWVGPITFTTLATCYPPTGLTVSNISATDAQVDWTAPVSGTPASYEYYVSTSATAPTNATPGNTPSLGSGATQTLSLGAALTPNTLHYVWVRSYCGLNPSSTPNYSTWSASASFTTLNTPCSGTPAPGNTVASLPSVCTGGTTVLSLQNATPGLGVTYQWYDGATNTAISGATNATYTTPALTAPADFYCIVDCGGNQGTSSTITIGMNSFYNCYCSSPSFYTGDEEIFGVSMTATFPAPATVSQTSTCSTTGGPGSILNAYSNYTANAPLVAEAGSIVNFSIDLNSCGGTYTNGTAIFIDLNQNGSFADAGEQVFAEPTLVSTPAGTGRVLTGSFTIPVTASTGVTGMRVMNTESYSGTGITPCMTYYYGETEDYLIDITTSPACVGTPTPGNAIATPASVCAGSTSTITLQTATQGTGVTYQWFDGATNTAISGATNASYTTPALTAASSYYCEVDCGGNVGTSSTVSVGINSFASCYCSTNLHSFATPCINDVVFNTLSNNTTAAPCALPAYTAYPTATTTTTLFAGQSYSLTTTSSATGVWSGVWIDYNQSGTFDASEYTEIVAYPSANAINTVTVNIPLTAAIGQTGMRIRQRAAGMGSGDACTPNFGSGETEDYVVTIDPAPVCTGTPTPGNTVAASNPVCQGTSATLSLQNATIGTGVTYQWYNGVGAIAGATDATYVTAPMSVDDTYYCEVTCSGNTGTSASLLVTVTPAVGTSMANPIMIGQAPCVSSPYTHTETNTGANCFIDNLVDVDNQSSPDVWYQFTLASATTVDISLCGSGFDTYLHLLDNTGAVINSNDDSGPICTGTASSLSEALTAGTYYIVTQGFGSNTGALNLSVNTIDPCSSTLNLTLFLQGYYLGGNTMAEVMANQGYLPTPAVGDCDDITVELHDAVTTTTVAHTATARLLANGSAVVTFPSAITGNYYIVIKHRNSLQTWSTDPVTFGTTTSYDFTTAAAQAYADQLVEVEPGVWAIYTGDLNQDDYIDSFDFPIFDLDATNGVSGVYVATDMNGDGYVDPFDFPVFDINSFNGVTAIYP